MTPAERALWGRVGAAVARSRHDPRDLTANARRTFLAKFEERVRAEYPGLPDAEVMRRAGELRTAHFLRLAAQSASARAKKKGAASPKKATPVEVDRASDPTTARAA